MTEFEIVVLTVSLVLGLGIAQILSAIAAAIRERERSRLHWLPISWGVLIFLLHVQYFFALMDMDAEGFTWTWDRYGPVLLYVVMLFLAGGLVLPSQRAERATALIDDFDRHGRLALIPLGVSLLMSIPMNVQAGGTWLSQPNLFNTVLVALLALVFRSKHGRWRGHTTIIYAAVQLYAMFFVWSDPGIRAPFR